MLIAVLGRGIQRQRQPLGAVDTTFWAPTDDLEMCAPDGSHLVERLPVDDHSPNCRIGGGELNLLAGAELYDRSIGETVFCCAYGNRSPYLVDVDGHSESEVMSVKLAGMINELGLELPLIVVWPKEKVVFGKSNTQRELQNIFELALKKGIIEVTIVTVAVHMPRTIAFAEYYLSDVCNNSINVSYYASEQVLVESDYRKYAPRVLAMYKSLAFARTAYFEHRGTEAFLSGNY